jgi:hypothetical protein
MPRRASGEATVKITLNVYEQDYERMKDLYAEMGPTVAIRQLIRAHLTNIDRKIAKLSSITVDEIELELPDD